MTDEEFKQQCEDSINSIIELLSGYVKQCKLPSRWKQILVDFRWAEGTQISKVRVQLQNKKLANLSDTPLENLPSDVDGAFYRLRKTMQSWPGEKWYGVKISLFPNGTHSLVFDPDPECAGDPTFWTS